MIPKHVVVAIFAIAALNACRSRVPETIKAAAPKAVPVTTAAAESRMVAADFQETGSFVADELSDIAPHAPGRVVNTPVDVGAFVKKGQVICELDNRDAELRLQQAKAVLQEATASVRQAQSRIGYSSGKFDPNTVPEVAAARANYQSAQAQAKLAATDATRYANLIATGDVSKSAYDRAKTQQETAEAQANAARQQYEAAANNARQSYEGVSTSQASLDSVKAQLAQAQKNLDDTIIRAPFDGFITARPVAAGEHVDIGGKIATIVRVGTLKLQLQTPEQRASAVKLGMKVVARVAAYPTRDFEGVVTAINPSVDPNSRVFILEAKFNNPDAALKPGMFGNARVLLPGGTNAIFIPRSAVLRDKTTDSNQVYAIQNGKARLRVVATGEEVGDRVRILSGIAGGELVATNNLRDLFEGCEVTTSDITTGGKR